MAGERAFAVIRCKNEGQAERCFFLTFVTRAYTLIGFVSAFAKDREGAGANALAHDQGPALFPRSLL